MRQGDQVVLGCAPTRLSSIHTHLTSLVAGKSVLNVGAGGGVYRCLPDLLDEWPHALFGRVARAIDAIDIDRDAIARAARYGHTIIEANCETFDFDKRYDAIVMGDVIEHVEQPGRALVNLCRHLADGGRLYVATPNATYLGLGLDALRGRGCATYWDHVQIFMPENIQAICDRHGLVLESVAFYTNTDTRTWSIRAKSAVMRAATALRPRLSQAFLAVIKRGAASPPA